MSHTTIILLSLILGLAAGFIMHRSDYCIAGMFRDLFLFRTTRMLKTLVLLILVSIPLFELLHLTGWALYPFPLFGTPSLVNILGGFLFGIGMVLAGGCVVGVLYKVGSGNVPSMVALFGLIGGSTLYAEFHPFWKSVSIRLSLAEEAVTVPQALGVPSLVLTIPVSMLLLALVYSWFRHGELVAPSVVKGYLQPWQAALWLALIGFLSVVITGMPLGITTSYAKIGAFIEQWLIPEHLASLTYFKTQPLDHVPPLGGEPLRGGAGPVLDGIAVVQFPLIAGIILGSTVSSLLLREFRIYLRVPPRQLVSALCGGVMLGLASRMAPACNVWHLMGGVPLLTMQSLLFIIGVIPGAWFGSKIFTRLVV